MIRVQKRCIYIKKILLLILFIAILSSSAFGLTWQRFSTGSCIDSGCSYNNINAYVTNHRVSHHWKRLCQHRSDVAPGVFACVIMRDAQMHKPMQGVSSTGNYYLFIETRDQEMNEQFYGKIKTDGGWTSKTSNGVTNSGGSNNDVCVFSSKYYMKSNSEVMVKAGYNAGSIHFTRYATHHCIPDGITNLKYCDTNTYATSNCCTDLNAVFAGPVGDNNPWHNEYSLKDADDSGISSHTSAACCANSNACTAADGCYDSLATIETQRPNNKKIFCADPNGGSPGASWLDCDGDTAYHCGRMANTCGYGWEADQQSGESTTHGGYVSGSADGTECCGDDSNEFITTLGVGPTKCCDSSSDCVDSGGVCRSGTEVCDGLDNDCDGSPDDGFECVFGTDGCDVDCTLLPDLTQGLVSYWSFDAAFGSSNAIAIDDKDDVFNTSVSGPDNDGLPQDNTRQVAAKVCEGYEFNGDGNHILVPHDNSLDLEEFTLSAWVKIENEGDAGQIIQKAEGDPEHDTNYRMALASGNKISCYFEGGGKNGLTYTFNPASFVGDFNHIVCTYDRSYQRMYLNGVEVASRTETSKPYNSGSYPVYIGVKYDDNNCPSSSGYLCSFFNGTIDEAGIWNRSLRSDEVQALYALTRTCPVDCDGQPVGTAENCYTGPPGTQSVGPCMAGFKTCQANGTWTGCIGEVTPQTESIAQGNCLDLIDNDCDTELDFEGMPVLGIKGDDGCPIQINSFSIGSIS